MELRTTSLQGALPWAQRRWRWRWRAGPPPWPARRPDCRRAPAPIARLCSPLLAAALLAAALPVTALPARALAAEPPLRAAPGQVPLAAPAPLPAQAPTAGEGAPAGTEDEGEGLPGALARSRELVAGQSFLLGLSVQTAKLELYRGEPFADGHGPSAKLTNNRELEAIARYTTAETYLREYPMRVGWFRVGYDFELSTTGFRTDRQETRNVIEGEALGTTSSGRLLGTGPMVFVRLGPLYPGGRIFWKRGRAAGSI